MGRPLYGNDVGRLMNCAVGNCPIVLLATYIFDNEVEIDYDINEVGLALNGMVGKFIGEVNNGCLFGPVELRQ